MCLIVISSIVVDSSHQNHCDKCFHPPAGLHGLMTKFYIGQGVILPCEIAREESIWFTGFRLHGSSFGWSWTCNWIISGRSRHSGRFDLHVLLERSDCLCSHRCRDVLLGTRSIQPWTIADVGECRPFDHSWLNVGSIRWCLWSLSFDNEFNHCLDLVTIPSCVQTIVFGDCFDQPLQRVS